MKSLNEAVARIALEVHPERIDAVCSALDSSPDANLLAVVKDALGPAFSPSLIEGLAKALKVTPKTSSSELSALFRVSSLTASLAAGASSVELVWTGPATGMVPIRHTAQVLIGLIEDARDRLFLVSFVAYHVGGVMDALRRATERGVQVRVLLEKSKAHGGNVNRFHRHARGKYSTSANLRMGQDRCGSGTHRFGPRQVRGGGRDRRLRH